MTTTVSSTHCCKSAHARFAAWLLALLACLWAGAPALAQQVHAEVTQLEVERSEEGILLTAHTRFDLPAPVDDALAKGIPMYFVAEATLLQERWYWYDRKLATMSRHMRLSYQPLTRRWRLQVSANPIGGAGLALGQTFDTREEALAAVQHVSRWKIADADLEPDARRSVEFRFRLDLSQLPRPFQIGAVGQSDWSVIASRSQRIAPDPPK